MSAYFSLTVPLFFVIFLILEKTKCAGQSVAALDNNANTGRNQARVQVGEHAGEARYWMCFPKAHKRWVVKPISEKKSYHDLSGMISEVIKWCEEGNAVTQP